MTTCGDLALPLYYSMPCWADHAPLRSGYNTPSTCAADFDPEYRLSVGEGFQPPDGVPGWLGWGEAELLWKAALGQRVLEIGAGVGQATVCLVQSATHVTAVDATDLDEAREWLRRFAVFERVAFASLAEVESTPERHGMGVVSARDAAGLQRDLAVLLKKLDPGGLLTVHNYPDPSWPDVRIVIDESARRLGWKRVAQAGYLAVFRM
jgi:SAM-dependent methyltransferase